MVGNLFLCAFLQGLLAVDIVSKTLSPELLSKLKEASAKECERNRGGRQVLPVVERMRGFLEANRVAPAYEDIKKVGNR